MNHLILQQYLHIELNGTESDGLALQSRLSELCHHWLIPVIERALDRCAPPDGHLCIEHLEIDAGTLTLEQLEHDLAESVAQALEKVLREQAPPDKSSPMITTGNVQRKTERQAIDEAWVYFLETGRLPWSFRLPVGKNLEQAVLDSWQKAPDSGRRLHFGNEAILRAMASASARKRLHQQFPAYFLYALLARLSPAGHETMSRVLEKLREADSESISMEFTKLLWEASFACVASGIVPTEMDLVSEVWRGLSVPIGQRASLASSLEHQWPGVTQELSIRPSPAEIPGMIPGAPGKDAPRMEVPETEALYIDNAGLVLLHPFLPRFFEALGIAAEDKLLQPDRALCLLHFLATGQPVAPEYELLFPKVLCNIPLETLVESEVVLMDEEKEEATALLGAVIRHWEALRSTSPDGLRGTFLVRPGKLSFRGGDWLLQVEPKTYDILLDQLPWGISMIKLPWMEWILRVEWGS